MCRRPSRAAVGSRVGLHPQSKTSGSHDPAHRPRAQVAAPSASSDVVGQQAVTQTLRNALTSGRIHQAFVFAGPRGVGKTTTARLLARALNCYEGPTAEPCGICDACVEIAQGRDMDVLEIDAATHTGIDNVREVIISGLAISPVRDRYKVFIIDEVHQLSASSFNALLKSVEEPPPHVVFIMATTSGDKIPDTILSRAQVFEFRPIGVTVDCRTAPDDRRRRAPHRRQTRPWRSSRGRPTAACAMRRARSTRSSRSRARRSRSKTSPPCSASSAATCCSTWSRAWPTRTRWRRSPSLAARWNSGTTCGSSAASWRTSARGLLLVNVDPSCAADPEVAHGERARAPRRARRALLARGSAARVRPAVAMRSGRSRRRRSRATTSRCCCCDGFTFASCCRSRT